MGSVFVCLFAPSPTKRKTRERAVIGWESRQLAARASPAPRQSEQTSEKKKQTNVRSVEWTTWRRFDAEPTGTSGRPVSVCLRGNCMKQPGLRASWPLWPSTPAESWHIQPDCRSAAAGSWLREPAAAGRRRPGRETSSVNWSAGTWTSTLCSRTWSASVRRTSTRFKTVKDELGLGNAQYFV